MFDWCLIFSIKLYGFMAEIKNIIIIIIIHSILGLDQQTYKDHFSAEKNKIANSTDFCRVDPLKLILSGILAVEHTTYDSDASEYAIS